MSDIEKIQHIDKGHNWANHTQDPHNSFGRVRLSWKDSKWKKYFGGLFERRNKDPTKLKKESVIGYTTPVGNVLSSWNYEGVNMNVDDIGLARDFVQAEQFFRDFIEKMEGLKRIKFNVVNRKLTPISRNYRGKVKKKEKIIITRKTEKNDK